MKKILLVKIQKFIHITGISNRTLKRSQVQKHTRLKICNTLALHTLLHGRELENLFIITNLIHKSLVRLNILH